MFCWFFFSLICWEFCWIFFKWFETYVLILLFEGVCFGVVRKYLRGFFDTELRGSIGGLGSFYGGASIL